MKEPENETGLALAFGFFGAPFFGVVNAVLVDTFSSSPPADVGDTYVGLAFMAMVLAAPLGFMTMRLLEIWENGHYIRARLLGLIWGCFALFFWFFQFRYVWSAAEKPRIIAALAIPILWSILFPLFALLARPPKC